jgi:hypothetical protein
MEYKVKYKHFWRNPKYGFVGKGTIRVESETVFLFGTWTKELHVRGLSVGLALFYMVLLAYLEAQGFWVDLTFWTSLFLVLVLSDIIRKRKQAASPISLEKSLITAVARDHESISFWFPDTRAPSGRHVTVFLELKSEEEAAQLENELKA